MCSNPEIDLVQSRDCSAHVTTRDRLSRQVLIVRAASEMDGSTRKLYKSCLCSNSSFPRPSPFFAALQSASVYYTERNLKNKNGGRQGLRLVSDII